MKRLALAVLVVLVMACATYRPPKLDIEKGSYQNYRHGFVIDIPGGWTPVSEIPKWFLKELQDFAYGGADLSHYFKMGFINSDSNGLILIGCKKMKASYDSLLTSSIRWRKQLSQELEKRKQWALGQGAKTLDYELYEFPLYGGKVFVTKVEFDETHENFRLDSTIFMYEIDQKTSMVEILLQSLPKKYGANYECYEKMVNSIRYGNSFTKPDKS